MIEVKARPGTYNRTNYRSQLEIQWAGYFDSLDIRYQYEPKRFELSSGSYLPDFYLPEVWYVEKKWGSSANRMGLWLEVKNPIKCLAMDECGIFKFDEKSETSKLMYDLINSETETIIKKDKHPHTYGPGGTVVWFSPKLLGEIECPAFTSDHVDDNNHLFIARHSFTRCEECNRVSFSRRYAKKSYGMVHRKFCSQYYKTEYILEYEA